MNQKLSYLRAMIGITTAAVLLLPGALVAQARDLVVYAEPTLRPIMRSVGQLWRARSGVRVDVFVARGELSFAQIERGARCDVIVAITGEAMDDAKESKLVKPGTSMPVFRNTLVLIGRDAQAPAGADIATVVAGKRLAIADPERDLAGTYAVVALGAAGLKVDPESETIAVAENSAGVLRFLADNKAQLGIVYATDAVRRPDFKVVLALAPSSHPAIDYVAAAAVNAQADTTAFLEFLRSDEAKAAIKAAGLSPIGN